MQFRLVVCSCAIHYVLCCTLLLCCITVVQGDQPDAIVSQDGAEMALIPTTEFLMGTRVSDLDKIVAELRLYSLERAIQRNWFEDETPQHRVFIDAYYMDKYEVIPFVARNAPILQSTVRSQMEIGFHLDGIK